MWAFRESTKLADNWLVLGVVTYEYYCYGASDYGRLSLVLAFLPRNIIHLSALPHPEA